MVAVLLPLITAPSIPASLWCRSSCTAAFLGLRAGYRNVREVNTADSESNTRAVDSLLNYETVKYFNNETFESERYDACSMREQARRKNRLSLFALNGGQALIIAAVKP